MAAVARIAVPSEAGVRDGKRKGFILGGGIGMGLTSYTYEENHNSVYYRRSSSKSESKATVLTDVKIGYAPSELVQVYLMSRVAWLSWEGDLTASGVHGLGVTYFFEPEAPSWFLTAGLGISTWEKVVLVQLGGGGRVTWYGFGLTMGAGYEFAPHSSVEGRVTWGNPNTGSDYFQESLNTLSLGVTVNFRRY
jgi:opacity protein-like surface antigen